MPAGDAPARRGPGGGRRGRLRRLAAPSTLPHQAAAPACLHIKIAERPAGRIRQEMRMIDRNRRSLVMAAGGTLAAGALGGKAWAGPADGAPGRKLGYAIVGLGSYGLGMIIPQ